MKMHEDFIGDSREQVALDLLGETHLWTQILLEDYLSVALGLRNCSLVTIPAEFPDGEAVAKSIDRVCVSDYRRVVSERDIARKRKLIQQFKDKLRKTYEETIVTFSSYNSHVAWANRLGLQVLEVEVRPTVRELYLHKELGIRRAIEKLSKERDSFRERLIRSSGGSLPQIAFAYAAEYSPEYVLRIGELLGYPKCCIGAYVEGRRQGNVLAEERASNQIRTMRKQGAEPDPHAYFSKDFFPCTPVCENAGAVGRRLREGFAQFDHRLSESYVECLKTNVAIVESHLEKMAIHKARMTVQAQELGIRSLK